jgi:putative ABC transport system ATP-binding protein
MMLALNRDKGVTFLFSTHGRRVMEHARRVVSIHDGAIVDGTVEADIAVARMQTVLG